MLELLRICLAELLIRAAIFIYPELEPEKKNTYFKCPHCSNPLATETLCSWCGWKPDMKGGSPEWKAWKEKLEPKKEPTIPERRIKRFELLQVVTYLYANKFVTLYGEHAGYWGEVVDELYKRGIPPKDIKIQTSSTSDQVRIILEVGVVCDHPLHNRSFYHDSSIKCDKCNCIIEHNYKL